jgi:hypothetical protein
MDDGQLESIVRHLYDFTSPRGDSVIEKWAGKERLSSKDRAKLENRLDRLAKVDFELAVGTSLLNGPVAKDIYKIKVYGQTMMRPMACRGPFNKDTEYTLLVGAIERDDELEPATCIDDASESLRTLLANRSRRRTHVRL